MDPLWLALSKLNRGKYAECIRIVDEILATTPRDETAWAIKCKAVIKQNFIDDIELEEESMAEMLLDDNATASIPRPGTSLSAPQGSGGSGSSSGSGGYDMGMRPITQSGRPVTGFLRPSSSRPMSGSSTSIRDALQSSQRNTSTARPMTSLGREVRLGTASLAESSTGALVDISRVNLKKVAQRTGMAMLLTEYLLYVEHNTKKALELCAEATQDSNFKSWWWKARLGKCYAKVGLLRDAEKQLLSSLKMQPIINTYLELCNVYMRLDLPNTALDYLNEASQLFTVEPRIFLGIARIYDMLNDPENAMIHYKKVLALDASNVESIACIGAHYFYTDQPEMSIRYYRRLLQMGVNNTELWNNIGLCCFYASQYDMSLSCFERALSLASDEEMADVWYNIGHVGIALGDLGLAYQAFKVAVSIDPNHGEALNNIAVLEMRRQKNDNARSCLSVSADVSTQLFEPLYNKALMSYRMGDFQDAFKCVNKALSIYPNHGDSKELLSMLQKLFAS